MGSTQHDEAARGTEPRDGAERSDAANADRGRFVDGSFGRRCLIEGHVSYPS